MEDHPLLYELIINNSPNSTRTDAREPLERARYQNLRQELSYFLLVRSISRNAVASLYLILSTYRRSRLHYK